MPYRLLVLPLLAAVLPSFGDAQPLVKAPAPLKRAHAHNDYAHPRPLHDALDQGFCSVEADIFLSDQALLVGHLPWQLKPERTLEKLYLDPLRERVKANGNRVYRGGPVFHLLVDVKTDAKATYAALAKVLERYADILSVSRGGVSEAKAVTVVVSGNCDRETIAGRAVRYAAIDGRPADLGSDAAAALVPWVSAAWGSQFRWDGTGPMPAEERAKLREFVAKAHTQGRLVRFWASPETDGVWRELVAADVDLINTDKLAELRAFLLTNDTVAKMP